MTEETFEHPFQPGVEVAIVSRSQWQGTSYKLSKVDKVHKSGRFTLVGDKQQYRACNWGFDSRWHGEATGDNRYMANVELMTDELREQVAATKRRARFKNVIFALDKEASKLSEHATDAQIADLERIYGQLKTKVAAQ